MEWIVHLHSVVLSEPCLYFAGTFLCLCCPWGTVRMLIPAASAFSVAFLSNLENRSSLVVEKILLMRLRVAKSLKNFRLERMNQISLITRHMEGKQECSFPSSKCYWLNWPSFTTVIIHLFPKQWLAEVWVDHAFPGTVTLWCFISTVNVILSTFL